MPKAREKRRDLRGPTSRERLSCCVLLLVSASAAAAACRSHKSQLTRHWIGKRPGTPIEKGGLRYNELRISPSEEGPYLLLHSRLQRNAVPRGHPGPSASKQCLSQSADRAYHTPPRARRLRRARTLPSAEIGSLAARSFPPAAVSCLRCRMDCLSSPLACCCCLLRRTHPVCFELRADQVPSGIRGPREAASAPAGTPRGSATAYCSHAVSPRTPPPPDLLPPPSPINPLGGVFRRGSHQCRAWSRLCKSRGSCRAQTLAAPPSA